MRIINLKMSIIVHGLILIHRPYHKVQKYRIRYCTSDIIGYHTIEHKASFL